ncbi:MAG: flagellar basal body rod protein FlgG [Gammaproteobacteria bacterium]|nr:MAG: flagellar basal-body rod protein FlgG [Pseudomonadota bacterium]MBC6944226.1 flagellar basal-body rod protein FlgG [Gammaproteobacteria bacterium]MCE7895814.1 flagellar basal-body rod protein FlgG [Gammaproteobacteria bacterium PRO8]MDL1879517.1 flagellar basal-body rod protein FlgG [Gammaproteobacteria bacterium PRO2]MCL4777558.1 flagellar basal-body rod protein FlgG [Gammaproteobacteria bacterium]
MESLWVAKTGLDAQQTRMTVVSNNLANVNTNGFKKGRAIFEDLLYQNVSQAGGATSQNTEKPTGLTLGTGVRVVATEKTFNQGSTVNTGNPFDVMISGRGFFQVLLPDGTQAYTRDGSFKIDSEGRLVTASGYELQPSITVPNGVSAVTISPDGLIQAKVTGQVDPVTLGTLQIADFINPAGLQPRGQNLLVETSASGTPQIGNPNLEGRGDLVQGALEGSNVNVVEELVGMIETQRAYEMNSKAIAVSDQMLQYLNNNL